MNKRKQKSHKHVNFDGFDRPIVCKKKILCLYSSGLKVHGFQNLASSAQAKILYT